MGALTLKEQSQRNRDGTVELAEFLKSCIDTSINFDGSGISENGFDVQINYLANGLLEIDFVPFMPFAGLLNEGLYEQIGSVLATALVPMATRITGTGMQVKPTGSTELSNARAFAYQFLVGNVQRIMVRDLSQVKVPNGVIPLMLDGTGHVICSYDTKAQNDMIAVSGFSGGGKTRMLLYLISCYLKLGSEIVIIDPKTDQALYRYARKQNLLYVSPAMGKSDLNFVALLQKTLRGALNQIEERQQRMAKDSSYTPRRLVIVLDELLSLVALIGTKQDKEITGLITKLMVMGRSSNVSVIIASQQLNANVLPTSCREQLSLRLQLTPNLNAKNCAFLFPTLEHPENIIIPKDKYQFGRGLVEVVDGSNQVLPFLSPLIVQGGH